MDLGFQQHVVFVTGGSRGIGRAAATLFASEGARVAVSYRRRRDQAEALAATIRAKGTDACAVALELASLDSIRAATDTVLNRWNRIDALVNNAVEFNMAPVRFDLQPADQWQRLVNTNVHGPFGLIQAVLPWMLSAGFGRVVNVSSTAAEDGIRGIGWYAVAKASLHGLTRTLAAEFSAAGILTNSVMPGPVDMPHVDEATRNRWARGTTLRRLPCPDEIARSIVFLASPANTVITGEIVRIGGRSAIPTHAWNRRAFVTPRTINELESDL